MRYLSVDPEEVRTLAAWLCFNDNRLCSLEPSTWPRTLLAEAFAVPRLHWLCQLSVQKEQTLRYLLDAGAACWR